MRTRYNAKWTANAIDLQEWNLFLHSTPRGHCQQVSHYLKSFARYPFFSFEVFVVKDKGDIVGGIGVVCIGIPFFKFHIAPSGPIIKKGYESLFDYILQSFKLRAKNKKAVYCRVNTPVLKEHNHLLESYTLSQTILNELWVSGKSGGGFPFLSGTNGFRGVTIDYSKKDVYAYMFNNFSSNTKRNIRIAQTNSLTLKYANSASEVQKAYMIIEKVAKIQKYKVRAWNKVKDMYLDMISEDLCIVPCCYLGDQMLGALIVFDIGQRFTYISGGVLRTEKDLKVGHFLQNEMIKLSIKKKYGLYDFGVAGSDGVTRFKKGFSAKYYPLIGPRAWQLKSI